MIKQGLNKDDVNRTMDEMFHNSLFASTTNASREQEPSRYNTMSKSVNRLIVADRSMRNNDDNPGFMLPSINKGTKGSPFKGFTDISIVT